MKSGFLQISTFTRCISDLHNEKRRREEREKIQGVVWGKKQRENAARHLL
jgi:hypothetical protein